MIPCASIPGSWQQTTPHPGRVSLPTKHPERAARPAPGQGAGCSCVLCSPASCSPRPGWSSGAAGPPARSGASCSGSRGRRSQPRSAKQCGRGKAGPREDGPRCTPLRKPSLAGPGAAAKGQSGMWRLISGGCEGLCVLWGTSGLQGWATSPVADSYRLIALRMFSTCPDPMSSPGTCILPRYHLNQLKSQQEHKLGQPRHVRCSPRLRDHVAFRNESSLSAPHASSPVRPRSHVPGSALSVSASAL